MRRVQAKANEVSAGALDIASSAKDATITVAVSEDEDFSAEILYASGNVRKIDEPSATCDALLDAVGVSIGLAMASAPSARPTTNVRWSVTLGPEVSFGITHPIAFGVTGSVRWSRGGWTLSPAFHLFPPSAIALGSGSVNIGSTFGAIAGCRSVLTPKWGAFGFCVSLLGGALLGQGVGYASNSEATRPWGAIGAGPELEGRVTRWLGLTLRARALLQTPERFEVTGRGPAFSPLPLAGIAELGVTVGALGTTKAPILKR